MRILAILPDGFSEIDSFTVIDIMRRAGIDVDTCGLVSTSVTGARKAKIIADTKLETAKPGDYDGLVLPGGPGYKNLINSAAAIEIIKTFNGQKKLIGAMCEAPVLLAKAGIIDDTVVVVYPGLEKHVPRPRNARVIVSGNVITCKAPADAAEFALKMVEITAGKKAAAKARQEISGKD